MNKKQSGLYFSLLLLPLSKSIYISQTNKFSAMVFLIVWIRVRAKITYYAAVYNISLSLRRLADWLREWVSYLHYTLCTHSLSLSRCSLVHTHTQKKYFRHRSVSLELLNWTEPNRWWQTRFMHSQLNPLANGINDNGISILGWMERANNINRSQHIFHIDTREQRKQKKKCQLMQICTHISEMFLS